MADRIVRRVRISIAGGYTYVSARGIMQAIDALQDPARLERLKAILLPLEYPPLFSGERPLREAAAVMIQGGTDFLEVEYEGATGILTAYDVLRGIEPWEADVPVAWTASRQYPTVAPGTRVVTAVHMMRVHSVDAVLVAEDDVIVGVLDTRHLLEALAVEGFKVLEGPVYNVSGPVNCTVTPLDPVSKVASAMSSRRSSLCIVEARGYTVGVIDELFILEVISGARESPPRLATLPPPVGEKASESV